MISVEKKKGKWSKRHFKVQNVKQCCFKIMISQTNKNLILSSTIAVKICMGYEIIY